MKFLALLFFLVSCASQKPYEVSDYHKGFAHGLRVGCTEAMFSVWFRPLDDHGTKVLGDFERQNQTCVKKPFFYLDYVKRNELP